MSDATPTNCSHSPRYIYQATDLTAYCVLCELIATGQELARARLAAQTMIYQHAGFNPPCTCHGCRLATDILK